MTTTTSTVLVVDDDDALAEMIGIVLAQEGYNAVFAKTVLAPLRRLCGIHQIWYCWISCFRGRAVSKSVSRSVRHLMCLSSC